MTDTTTTAAPAPTVTEGAAAPAPTPTVTEAAPKTAADFLARIRDKANGGASVATSPAPAASAPTVDATGRVHGTDGKFVPKPAGGEPAASAPADGGVAPPQAAAAEAVAERVRIALDEGHPLRERGLTELPFDVPKEHEEIARYLAGQPVKKREYAQAQELARQAEAQAAEARAEAAFWRENAGSILTPEFYAKYADIKQTYGEADAELYKQAIMAQANGKLAERVGAQRAEHHVTATANRFRSLALEDAGTRFPGWTRVNERGEAVPTPEMEVAFRAYGAFIAATGKEQPSAEDWYSIATPLYDRSPAGQQRRADEARRIAADAAAKATADAAEKERQALEQAAQNRQRNPFQGVPNIQTGLAVPGTNTGPRTAREFLDQTSRRARGLA